MSEALQHLIRPDWPAPPNISALVTTRLGGVSQAPFASFNLASHVGDAPQAVLANRQRLGEVLPAAPRWLEQVHGVNVVNVDEIGDGAKPTADAAFSRSKQVVCVVQTADCLPILLAQADGSVVAAVHAGWRGLADGVIEATLRHLGEPTSVLAWLGPAIGPTAFEVGEDVRSRFLQHDQRAAAAFVARQVPNKWLADIYALARLRLNAAGVSQISGGDFCTFSDPTRFYSYRRDGVTGRMASMIWINE